MLGRHFYTESGRITAVNVIEDRSDEEFERYLLRFPSGIEAEVSYRKGEVNDIWKLTTAH